MSWFLFKKLVVILSDRLSHFDSALGDNPFDSALGDIPFDSAQGDIPFDFAANDADILANIPRLRSG
jgi:hypothetical protein